MSNNEQSSNLQIKDVEGEEIRKVDECYNNSELYQCERCRHDTDNEGWYCNNCNEPQVVNFDIEEDGYNLKGEIVCPYCYNQLIDIKQSKKEQENVKNV